MHRVLLKVQMFSTLTKPLVEFVSFKEYVMSHIPAVHFFINGLNE